VRVVDLIVLELRLAARAHLHLGRLHSRRLPVLPFGHLVPA
jgi:hypothetical protein